MGEVHKSESDFPIQLFGIRLEVGKFFLPVLFALTLLDVSAKRASRFACFAAEISHFDS
jgi:uncharacterized PurR-regulated membrane protein YhhQ (DUF165 family)